LDLVFLVVEEKRKSGVNEIDLSLIEAESYRKLERFAGAAFYQGVVNAPILSEIRAVAEDRLLKIAHHAEVTGARRIGLRVEPVTTCSGGPGNLQQDRELLRISVLRFVENDAEISLAD